MGEYRGIKMEGFGYLEEKSNKTWINWESIEK